jgi:hypothetical protein
MTHELEIIWHLIHRLRDVGLTVVCCGGAARDTFLGRKPKDYDFVILKNTSIASVQGTISQCTGNPCYSMREFDDDEGYENAQERGLIEVFESKCADLTVQFLLYEDTVVNPPDPYQIVETFDCDLNRAWFEDIGDRLVARVHGDFPSPFTGNINRFSPGVADDRKALMRQKFPDYIHQ